jgi:threonine aldolase
MNFSSDNVYGVHPRILAALSEANAGTQSSYGTDDLSRKAEERLSEIFEKEVRAFLVTTGTAANGLALSSITPGYGAIICHAEAHISLDECNSPEFFTGGAKIIGLQAAGGKIKPAMIEKTLKGFIRGEHDPKPKGVSITNVTELGTIYSPEEVKAISACIKPRAMKLHVDGARFANLVASLDCAPADVTWRSGVDVMSFGATKNGAMMLEATIFFDLALAEDFAYRRMRSGQLVSKSRYLGAQMLAYLENGLWLENARRANALAQKLVGGLRPNKAVRLAYPVEANEIFAIIPRALNDRLIASGVKYFDWMPDSLGDSIRPEEIFVRFVLSYATPEAEIDQLIELIAEMA